MAALAAGACLAACATPMAPGAPSSRAYADHLVGSFANLRQDHEAAAERYFAALRRDPHNAALIEGAAASSLTTGDIVAARRAARLATGDDAPPSVLLIRAADHLAAGRWRQAEQTLQNAEGRAAQNLTSRMMLVWARAAQGNVDDVIADLAPLASIRPYGALFSYQQGMALDLAGRTDEALAAYGEAAEGGMFLPPAVERHADLLARSGARAEALALLEIDANRVNPALAAASARLLRGEPAASVPLTPARGAASGLYGLAALFLQENDTTSALEALTLSLMLDPGLDASRLLFAQTLSEQDQDALARRALAGVGPASPYAPSARVMEAWLQFESGEEEQALTRVREAAEGGDLRATRALADMYRSLERYGEAEAIYTRLLQGQPNEWRLYFARGVARERQQRWPEAEADFRRALELSPEQPDVMNYLAYFWVERGEHLEEALAMLRRAVELRPSSGAIIDSLAWAHYRLGDYDQALLFQERAVELMPADATLNDHLGDIYWQIGKYKQAVYQWRTATN
ncbi:MAG: tetratricopeptide repeat protein, partial [Hyphomonadaceae bacterium]|nr:tetratricopeptide repeat protein [Hyphomonadaceae bacterium]